MIKFPSFNHNALKYPTQTYHYNLLITVRLKLRFIYHSLHSLLYLLSWLIFLYLVHTPLPTNPSHLASWWWPTLLDGWQISLTKPEYEIKTSKLRNSSKLSWKLNQNLTSLGFKETSSVSTLWYYRLCNFIQVPFTWTYSWFFLYINYEKF